MVKLVTKVYLVRHAEAMGNILEVFQGHTDKPLTDKGRKQLECLSERFRDINFDVLYSSPLERTMDTARAVDKYHNHEIIQDSELIEINGGVWEGKKWADIPKLYPAEYDLWVNKMHDFHVENGETMVQVYERMKNAVNKIVKANIGKTIVIVSHGCAIRNYLCYASGKGVEVINDMGWADNTAVSLVQYDDDLNPSIIFKNNSDHLTDELSTLKGSKWCKPEADGNYSFAGAYYKDKLSEK